MKTVRFEQAVAYHEPRWGCWPTGSSRDYGEVRARRWLEVYEHDGVRYEVTCRWFPVYAAYSETYTELRQGVPVWFIKNDTSPPEAVLRHQLVELETIARECRVLYWRHCVECFPFVADRLRAMFDFTFFCFDDAAPGSCETKTWPVLHGFDAMIHSMWVRSYQTGELVVDEYKKRGLPYSRFAPIGTSDGLAEWLAETGFSLEEKAAQHRRGDHDHGLVFVGSDSHDNPARAKFAKDLNARAGELDAAGIPTKIHGLRMRDGILGGYAGMLTPDMRSPIAPLYARAAMSLNFPVASLFNMRFGDLPACGVVQLAHDRWGELSHFGFQDGVHYVGFDGTFGGLKRETLRLWKDGDRRAEIVAAARPKHDAFRKAYEQYPMGRVYGDHRTQIERGR